MDKDAYELNFNVILIIYKLYENHKNYQNYFYL